MNRILEIIIVIFIFVDIFFFVDKIDKKHKAEYNKCVRILINEDYIENGCDKYFLNDKWYKDFMQETFNEYKKIK